MALLRTDAHRPSALVPADYDFVTFGYLGDQDWQGAIARREQLARHFACTGGQWSRHEHGGSCHICGAGCMYTAIFHHVPSNVYIRTGLDCAEKMELAIDNGLVNAFKKEVKGGLAAIAGKAKAQKILAEAGLSAAWDLRVAILAFYKSREQDLKNGVEPDDQAASPFTGYEEDRIYDIVGRVVQYGEISEKQTSFVRSLLERISNRAAIAAARKAENAASGFVGAIKQRRDFTATVIYRTSFDTAFGTKHVTGMKDADGNVLVHKGSGIFTGIAKGDKVTFKATVSDHSVYNDTKQTVVTRPAIL
jgi:hypothetical protein